MKKELDTNNENIIEEYERIQRRDRVQKIILIIIIIILLLLCISVYRVGKIGYQPTSTTPGDSITLIKVTDNDLEVTKDTQLDIFKNAKFDGEKMIAPMSNGEYKFCIENVTDRNITYDIKFSDEMDYAINMKYRLKIDNVYIRGNENNYISIDELNTENIIVLKDSINVFTLEWYWENDDVNDTIVGSQKTDQTYTLNLDIGANVYDEQR